MQTGQIFSVGQVSLFSVVKGYPGMEQVEFEVLNTTGHRVLSAKQGSVAVVVENSCAWVEVVQAKNPACN